MTAPFTSNSVHKQPPQAGKQDAGSTEAYTSDGHGAQPMDTTDQTARNSAVNSEPSQPALAPEILAMIASINDTLNMTFSTAPPHTVQRLAELLQRPNEHYRSLSKFLRAIQRVISVSSTVDQFPLPSAVESQSPGMLNILGSDESLGGALLTPISWLQNDHSSDTETDTRMNGVPESEGSRQEHAPEKENAPTIPDGDGGGRQQVHAQGPRTLGPEDLGPQPPGVVFLDLDEPSSGPAIAVSSKPQAEADEMTDVPMAHKKGTTESPPSNRNPEDRMDVDDLRDRAMSE